MLVSKYHNPVFPDQSYGKYLIQRVHGWSVLFSGTGNLRTHTSHFTQNGFLLVVLYATHAGVSTVFLNQTLSQMVIIFPGGLWQYLGTFMLVIIGLAEYSGICSQECFSGAAMTEITETCLVEGVHSTDVGKPGPKHISSPVVWLQRAHHRLLCLNTWGTAGALFSETVASLGGGV